MKKKIDLKKFIIFASIPLIVLCILAFSDILPKKKTYVIPQAVEVELIQAPVVIALGEEFNPESLILKITEGGRDHVTVDNPVDINTPGNYLVTFSTGFNTWTKEVTVADTTVPVIVLKDGPFEVPLGEKLSVDYFVKEIYYEPAEIVVNASVVKGNLRIPGDASVEISVSAADGKKTTEIVDFKVIDTDFPVITLVEGDYTFEVGSKVDILSLVKKVEDGSGDNIELSYEVAPDFETKIGEVSAIISATDENGNKTSVPVKIMMVDTEPPKLILKRNTFNIKKGASIGLSDMVAEATDNCGAVKLSQKTISGSLEKEGSCKIAVTATDSSGNETTKEVKVNIKTPVYNSLGWDVSGEDNQPYFVGVNRKTNVVTVYSKDSDGNYTKPHIAFYCSVGKEGNETPTGTFATTDRYRWRLMVDNTYAQYAIRISGQILFHSVPYYQESPDTLEWPEYNKLGTAASLGCIRMRVSDVLWLYNNCPTGFTTVIYDGDADPIGVTGTTLIDESNEVTRNWDPTDPTEGNPWRH